MGLPRIVIDTNILVSGMRSKRGADYHLLRFIGSEKFTMAVSIPLILEYEHAAKNLLGQIALNAGDIDDILDYVCSIAEHQKIFYLWRPFLPDPKDDMILELAVAARCNTIITYNRNHFRGVEQFGIRTQTAREFLQDIGELK